MWIAWVMAVLTPSDAVQVDPLNQAHNSRGHLDQSLDWAPVRLPLT